MEEKEKDGLPNLQWFPGHMKKAQRLIEENLKLVDVAIELLDARIPYSSANPMLAEIIKDKPRLVALNKSDLADPAMTKAWLAYFREQGMAAVSIDSLNGKGMKQLVKLAEDLARPKTEKLVAKGGKARAARCMILGIPNVGKSSLINRLAGSVKAKAADKPGVTRAKQWIKLGSNHREKVTALLLETMRRDHPERLVERFKFKDELPETGLELLDAVGRKRGCLVKGGVVDLEKAVNIVLMEFRSGKLGAVTLDAVPAEELAGENEGSEKIID